MGDLELPDALRDELRAAWHRYIDLKEDSHDQPPRQPAHRAYLRRPTRAPVPRLDGRGRDGGTAPPMG